jgi:head-tail adaptor
MSIRASVTAQRLRQRVRWERNFAGTAPSGGQLADDWRLLIDSAAAVDGMLARDAREALIEGGIRTPSDYTVWIRSDIFRRFHLTELDRGVWMPNGTILNITSIPDQGLEGRLIAVLCHSGLNQG